MVFKEIELDSGLPAPFRNHSDLYRHDAAGEPVHYAYGVAVESADDILAPRFPSLRFVLEHGIHGRDCILVVSIPLFNNAPWRNVSFP